MTEGEKFHWEPALDPDSIVIPGLNTAAPTADQIEQIDQLITLKLQKIDGQFAKIQWLAEHKLLPAVKRYSNGVQPVREAARFWVQFFEMAARMRVPRNDDFEDTQQEEDIVEEDDRESEAESAPWETTADRPATELDLSTSTVTTGTDDVDIFDSTPQPSRSRSHSRQGLFDSNKIPSESSFLPGGEIISSTPAAVGKRRAAGLEDDGPSWTSSIESSLHRLNEELDMLGVDPNSTQQSQDRTTSTIDETPAASIHESARSKGKGRAKPPESPMLRTILTKNASTGVAKKAPPSPIPFDVGIPGLSTPLRRDAAKILARMNPYLPSNTKPNDWSSVVDLSVHKLSSPKRQPPESSSSSRFLSEGGGFQTDKRIGHGLPSPITVKKFERPSRGPELQQTPRKEAAARIGKDLLWDAGHRQQLFSKHDLSSSHASSNTGPDWDTSSQRRPGKDSNSTASTIVDPPSLSRYADPSDPDSTARSELDLDSIMRRVGLDLDVKSTDFATSSTSTASKGPTVVHPVPTFTKPPVQRTFEPPVSTGPAPVFTRALRTPSSERHRRELEQRQKPYGSTLVAVDNETVIGRGPMEDEDDSFDDDDDQPNNTANPSAAFLAASQRQGNFDNSFDSNDDSFSGDEASGEGVAVHPFATFGTDAGFDDDDSFDDSMQMGDGGMGGDTETVFGARHAQMPAQAPQQLRMFGEEIVDHSQGFGATITSQESPTPKWQSSRG